jgi:hypothetical protein
MDSDQLKDEAVRDRIRLAEEFLDPSEHHENVVVNRELMDWQMTHVREGT